MYLPFITLPIEFSELLKHKMNLLQEYTIVAKILHIELKLSIVLELPQGSTQESLAPSQCSVPVTIPKNIVLYTHA